VIQPEPPGTPPALVRDEWFPRALPENVEFGPWTTLWSSFAFLHCRSEAECAVRVGRHTGIYWGTFFELGPRGQVEIGDYSSLASPVFATNGRVSIGSHVLISYDTFIADSFAALPPDVPRADADVTAEPAEIVVGDLAWIGLRSVLLPGARIGEGAIVAAGTVVDFEVPPYAVAGGNPGRIVGEAAPRARHRAEAGG
jgi:acetyltransferase-like isoleucine patch superfamily enzyme